MKTDDPYLTPLRCPICLCSWEALFLEGVDTETVDCPDCCHEVSLLPIGEGG